MDWQIILLWIGLFITFVLGLINFLWGPAILTRREKVAIVLHDSWANFVPKGKEEIGPGEKLIPVNNHSLHIHISCALVLTRGEKDIEVMEVEIRLHKETCEELKKYFRLPNRNGFPLQKYAIEPLEYILQPKKPVDFTADQLFECTDEFERECDKLGFDLYPESDDWGEYTKPPDFIKPLLEKLSHRFELCWERYDGKRLCWRFPDKWWGNLGKKLWG